MNVFYTVRYNSFLNVWEVLEHVPELETIHVIKACKEVFDAQYYRKLYADKHMNELGIEEVIHRLYT